MRTGRDPTGDPCRAGRTGADPGNDRTSSRLPEGRSTADRACGNVSGMGYGTGSHDLASCLPGIGPPLCGVADAPARDPGLMCLPCKVARVRSGTDGAKGHGFRQCGGRRIGCRSKLPEWDPEVERPRPVVPEAPWELSRGEATWPRGDPVARRGSAIWPAGLPGSNLCAVNAAGGRSGTNVVCGRCSGGRSGSAASRASLV